MNDWRWCSSLSLHVNLLLSRLWTSHYRFQTFCCLATAFFTSKWLYGLGQTWSLPLISQIRSAPQGGDNTHDHILTLRLGPCTDIFQHAGEVQSFVTPNVYANFSIQVILMVILSSDGSKSVHRGSPQWHNNNKLHIREKLLQSN